MNITRFAAAIVFVSTLWISIWANDMVLTLDDGQDAILHEDKTWGYAKGAISHGDEEDIYITIDNGKIILLRTDGTWDYTTKSAPQKKSAKQLPEVYANGVATKPTLDAAVQGATVQAIQRAATRLVPYAKKSKSTKKFLEACIKNEIGSQGAEVTYKPGWTAEAKINLTKVQVKNIVDCVETQIDAAAQQPVPAPSAGSAK
ncbi:MAG: DUF3157 family protein [Chitinispirillaceae bacterium]|nr:DUF3157 family protein [Chitinispirillaceae bacterium]